MLPLKHMWFKVFRTRTDQCKSDRSCVVLLDFNRCSFPGHPAQLQHNLCIALQ